MCLIQTVYHLGSHVKWLIMFKTNRNRLGDRMCCNKTISFLNLDLKFNLKARKMASRDVLALLLKNSFFLYMKNDFGLDNTSLYTCLGIPAKSGYLLYDSDLPYLATYFCPMVGRDQGQDQAAAQPVSN